jgi:amino acid adenylation domain-containing protein
MNEQDFEDSYPLSPVQQGMLFHDLYAPHSGMYLQQLVCAFHEELNVTVFKKAWQRVIARHPVLRTSFHWEDLNEPIQRIHKHFSLQWVEEDWRSMSYREQKRQLDMYLRSDRQQGFRMTEAPLMRAALFLVNDAYYRFIWTSHHAIMDGRSRYILLKEVFAFYEAFCSGKDIQLEHPRPYRDYIDWLVKKDFNKAEDFWRHMLKGVIAHTPLVVDDQSHRRSHKNEDYGIQEIRLSAKFTSTLQSLSRQHGLTPNTLLQGAWALLLSRYSGEQYVVFGAPRACRRSAIKGGESMVGLFINTLPIKVGVPPKEKLLPWLKELRSEWVALRDYEHTPITRVQEWSDIASGKPLFENLLSFENYNLTSALQAQGGKWVNREFKLIGFTNYPIAVAGYLESELLLEISYDRNRFEDITISRMMRHLQTLLENVVANPQQRLSEVPMLTKIERNQMLFDWNDTSSAYPRRFCVHELFEQQVEQTPDTIALVYEDKMLTYRQLNTRANQLAHYLKKLGVHPEIPVGLCLERSLEMVISLLGILKAGGFYVPLDPAYPDARLALMLADSQAPVLLTQQKLLKGLPQTAAHVVFLDADWEAIGKESYENPNSGTVAENLAYVMYTSGSTGRPKGVSVNHRSVVRLVKETNYVKLSAEEVFLQFSPISFDASTFEIWASLLNGARLVIFPAYMPSLAELGRAVEKYKITTLWLTAGLFHIMVEDHIDSLHSVRQLLAGGDVLSVTHVQKIYRQLNDCQLINGYGPTENTTFTCCYPIADSNSIDHTVPIGRPIANTQVYILDASLQPVPVGVSGELYISGDGLARGYFNRAEQTAENFIPHPFSEKPGDRLYQTGDLARYLSDGSIEFLGRQDHQVKIRGFRIELAEIEAVLAQHVSVREAIVLAIEAKPSDKRLVAYVVTKGEKVNKSSELRNFLKQRLPDYMVPQAYVYLDALPLTPNGKVDRQALSKHESNLSERENELVAPKTATAIYITGIWRKLLGINEVGIYDNFFELGGHSLLATRVISHISDTFKVELPLHCFFETPTVAGLTEALKKYEAVPGQVSATARILIKIDAMEPDEIRAMLREKRKI